MRIPINQCVDSRCEKCGRYEFSFMYKENKLGLFCSSCGRFLKWAEEDDKNLYELNKTDSEVE